MASCYKLNTKITNMERPDFRTLPYDLGNELEDLKNYKKDLEKYTDFLESERTKQLDIQGVMFELPDYMEVRKRIKHVVENSFEDYEVVEKREYTLGFNACYNWLKIKFMQRKGN